LELEELRKLKGVRRVTMLTAYDYQMAKIQDAAGIDMILVGDSLGMVVLGYEGTKEVTMHDMMRHTAAVARGTENAFIVGDMPINTYDTPEDALANARRFIEAGAHAVKIEGNKPEIVRALISEGIPAMGHLGLLPQTAEQFKVQGKRREDAERILAEAVELDAAGAFAIVLECIPLSLAKKITEAVNALTVGIGAGVHCDGQVLVVNDMLGMDPGISPKHSKPYVKLYEVITGAVRRYIEEVLDGKFPDDEHSFH